MKIVYRCIDFLNNLFGFGGPRAHVVKRSIDGTPLLELVDHGYLSGTSLRRTNAGLNGCLIHARIDIYFPDSIELAKQVLRGELDSYLEPTDKKHLADRISRHLEREHIYGMGKTEPGKLGVVRSPLSKDDRIELTHLLDMYHSHQQ